MVSFSYLPLSPYSPAVVHPVVQYSYGNASGVIGADRLLRSAHGEGPIEERMRTRGHVVITVSLVDAKGDTVAQTTATVQPSPDTVWMFDIIAAAARDIRGVPGAPPLTGQAAPILLPGISHPGDSLYLVRQHRIVGQTIIH